MHGILYGVGVGPGDPRLMTFLAAETIKKCEVLAVPARTREQAVSYQIARGLLPELDQKACLSLAVPMTKDRTVLNAAYEQAADLVEEQLKAVFLLIDIRHDPSANDRMMYQWIVEQGYHPIIIATKLDKIKRSQIQKHVKMLKQGLDLVPGTKVLPFSSVSKQGKEDIWELIEAECFNVEAQDGE